MRDETLPEPPKNERSWSDSDTFFRVMIGMLLFLLAVNLFGLIYLATGGDRRWAPNLFPPRPQRACCECCKPAPTPEHGR